MVSNDNHPFEVIILPTSCTCDTRKLFEQIKITAIIELQTNCKSNSWKIYAYKKEIQ